MDRPSEFDSRTPAGDNDRIVPGRRPLPNLTKVIELAAQPAGRSAPSKTIRPAKRFIRN
jgi:hypothetical protein